MNGHHLILGELTDYITGERLADTHDERYRQKLARFLIENKGYRHRELTPRFPLVCRAGEKSAMTRIDLLVSIGDKVGMIIKYAPGSLVTRRRPVLAASRLVTGYQVPVAVVTNGEDAEVIEAASGKVLGNGLKAIPDRWRLSEMTQHRTFESVSKKRAELESRIYYAYEVDGCCPCDDTVCKLP
jgi:hypothetical protein